ncbi:Hypothetical protein SMAX5B_000055 [Scophthalmus maximus]|uniref:Uncharacterized protein n=1 Tax=Scophthalmus maximus TaxID=52904 RepID=A0A2U9CVT2_SCOMX|nr:Hypothetical protein SMAX5B_000055 [Scophthalmus maximus]KAF0023732.1 hypothetical protein F2P81_024362 [Scophthalmus maximus]
MMKTTELVAQRWTTTPFYDTCTLRQTTSLFTTGSRAFRQTLTHKVNKPLSSLVARPNLSDMSHKVEVQVKRG